ncbi:outer membrane lipoprotein-sorting protein [Altererythrobacter sp. MF3-039]|uniref:outer membrane lipoprotein-sorting protein n=1 Tax=Altererythrobacter sp. MF3-039 TaxID=3252901 RepID=UPI00390C84D3
MRYPLKSLLAAAALGCIVAPVAAQNDTPGSLAQLVAKRAANEGRVGTMHFALKNKAGKTRSRTAIMVHSDQGSTEKVAIFFTKPTMIADTAFLSYNHVAKDDQNWLFLPATKRVRRLPVSERGDYFMGTDLTYGDLQDNFKFGLDDWTFTEVSKGSIGGKSYPMLKGKARNAKKAAQMGYSSFKALIDKTTGFPVYIEFADKDGDPLKRVRVYDIEKVGGVHTAMRFSAHNIQTGHTTEVHFTGMRYVPGLRQSVFDPNSLADGLPKIK